MSDDPKEPDDRAADSTQPDEAESPKLREVSEDELEGILAEHEKWLASGGNEGQRADLQGAILVNAKLKEADLSHANLQWAVLNDADLRGANLSRANLQRAVLREADLQGCNLFTADLQKANLILAKLQGAKLREADLQDAHLQGAFLQGTELVRANLQRARMAGVKGLETAVLTDINLEGATGLLGSVFAGMDITGAKLPADIAKFEGLDHVTEISKHARNIFLAVIGGCVFSWLTIATTTDVALLTNTASTPLPIIQTKVPIAGFYFAAPLILLSLYIYLHMYLQRLWSGLAGLPAIFPDGRTLDERAYPWLLTSLVGVYVPLLEKNRPPFSRQQVFLSILTAWCLVPGTIGWFWLRYLPIHDWIGTGVHIALVALAVTAGVGYFWRAQATLRGRQLPKFTWKIWRWRSPVPYAHGALFLGLAAAAIVVSDGAINGDPPDRAKLSFHRLATPFGAIEIPLVHRKFVPVAFDLVGYRTALNIGQEDVSIKPTNWTGLEVGDDFKAQIARVKGAQLAGRDLRYAAARDVFLVKADLSGANLQNADLRRANLQEAKLTDAKLQKANLRSSWLQGADLWKAKLQGAKLRFAVLRRANLESADLQGTDLTFADLRKAKGLTKKQLDSACGDEDTKLEKTRLPDLPEIPKDYKLKPCPKEPK